MWKNQVGELADDVVPNLENPKVLRQLAWELVQAGGYPLRSAKSTDVGGANVMKQLEVVEAQLRESWKIGLRDNTLDRQTLFRDVAIPYMETGWNSGGVSHAGARGHCQIMPEMGKTKVISLQPDPASNWQNFTDVSRHAAACVRFQHYNYKLRARSTVKRLTGSERAFALLRQQYVMHHDPPKEWRVDGSKIANATVAKHHELQTMWNIFEVYSRPGLEEETFYGRVLQRWSQRWVDRIAYYTGWNA